MGTRFYPRQTDYIVQLNALDDAAQLAIAKGDMAAKWANQVSGEVVPGQGYSAYFYAVQTSQIAANVNSSVALAQAWASQTSGTIGNTGLYSANYYASQSSASATLAQNWATSLVNTFSGAGGMYGAKYYANDAASSAATTKGYRDSTFASVDLAQAWASQASGVVNGTAYYSALKYATDASGSAALSQAWASQATGVVNGTSSYSSSYYASQSGTSATLAQNWATSMVNTFTGAGGLYGAKYYATDASTSATSAKNWATQATTEVVTGQGYSAKQYAVNSGASATLAQKWANLTGTTVDGSEYSAKKYAADAKAFAQTAQTAAQGATQGQINSDWNEADSAQRSFIVNKPHIPANGGDIGLPNVENKSAAEILSELSAAQVFASIGDAMVKTDAHDQSIDGTKTFTHAIKVPTIAQSIDTGNDAASTQYVADFVAKAGIDVPVQLRRATALAILGL